MVCRNFPSLHSLSSRETRGIKHNNTNKISGKSFLHKLNQQLSNDLPNVMNFVRINVASLNKSHIADAINDRLNLLTKTFQYLEWSVN